MVVKFTHADGNRMIQEALDRRSAQSIPLLEKLKSASQKRRNGKLV